VASYGGKPVSGAKVTFRDEDVVGVLARLIAASGDMKGAYQNIGEELRQSTIDRMRAGQTPEGNPFAKLNPLYAKFEKKGPGILRESGELLGSIVYQLAGDGAGVEVGTDRLHARVHQFGATILPKNANALVFSLGGKTVHLADVTIPARPFLGVSETDKTAILEILSDFLDEASGGELEKE
jgi:phage virion morphogenesis protein